MAKVRGPLPPSDQQQRVARGQHASIPHRLEMLLRQGLESGRPTAMTPEDWESIRKRVLQRTVVDE